MAESVGRNFVPVRAEYLAVSFLALPEDRREEPSASSSILLDLRVIVRFGRLSCVERMDSWWMMGILFSSMRSNSTPIDVDDERDGRSRELLLSRLKEVEGGAETKDSLDSADVEAPRLTHNGCDVAMGRCRRERGWRDPAHAHPRRVIVNKEPSANSACGSR